MRFAALLLLATPAAADDVVITSTANISIGAMDAGFVDGFAAPGGHFDLGVSLRNVRVQGEADIGLWTTEEAPQTLAMSGSQRRIGAALRYYVWNIDLAPPRKEPHRFRVYVEGGMGRHRIVAKHALDGPSLDIARNDIAVGFGITQETGLGGLVLGGHFGIRALITDAPVPTALYAACRGPCAVPSYRTHDIAVFALLGWVVGR